MIVIVVEIINEELDKRVIKIVSKVTDKQLNSWGISRNKLKEIVTNAQKNGPKGVVRKFNPKTINILRRNDYDV